MTIILKKEAVILLLAASIDYLIADPKNLLHPVQIMGWIINKFSNLIIKHYQQKWLRRLGGIILGGGLIIGSALVGWLLVKIAMEINFYVGILVEIIILASCFALRSLRLAAIDVIRPMERGEIEKARANLSQYVGRDTANLSEEEIYRAVLETVAENTTDGVTAPLFYAILGAFTFGSIPLALAYKAASTLDSSIGYLKEPYIDLGWFSAKLEDILTWIPCRLTVFTLAFFSKKPEKVLTLCRRDAIKDSSPNSGWSECVYAAILDVQLGGTNSYGGVAKYKPLLGDAVDVITSEKIYQALSLSRWCFLLWLFTAVALIK